MADGAELMMSMISMISTMWPPQAVVSDGSKFDFIVVGSVAGAVVASRLSEIRDFNVLLIEAGGYPTDDSLIPAKFPTLPNTFLDYNFTTLINPYAVSQEKGRFILSNGKVLGGSSTIHHGLYLRGPTADYDEWADLLNDPSWKYGEVLRYFTKIENLKDNVIMNSDFKKFHGTDGFVNITTQRNDVASAYIAAFEELGFISNVDMNSDNMIGYGHAQYNIDLIRQNTAVTYVLAASNRPNFNVLINAFVTKIVMENNVAVGVEVVLESGEKITIKAEKEVILSAGVVNSPKMLNLAGIGKKEVLEKYNITVVSELPVGDNLQGHYGVPVVTKMHKSSAEQSAVLPEQMPFPIFIGSVSTDGDDIADYNSINLLFEHDSDFLMAACSVVFGLKSETCNMFVTESVGRDTLFSIVYKSKTVSQGSVEIQSADPYVDPIIDLNIYNNEADFLDTVSYYEHFLNILDSEFFKNASAEVIKPDLTECSKSGLSYGNCYVQNYTINLFHPTSTCPMGTVVDSNCKVIGVERLRVVDASVLPNIPRANPLAAVLMVAEKIADVIKNTYPINETS